MVFFWYLELKSLIQFLFLFWDIVLLIADLPRMGQSLQFSCLRFLESWNHRYELLCLGLYGHFKVCTIPHLNINKLSASVIFYFVCNSYHTTRIHYLHLLTWKWSIILTNYLSYLHMDRWKQPFNYGDIYVTLFSLYNCKQKIIKYYHQNCSHKA